MSGDGSTGSGGSWEVKDKVVVCSDNITGSSDRTRIDKICEIIKGAGKEAISGEINPSAPYHMNSAHSNCTIFSIVGGTCWGTSLDYKYTLSGYMKSKGNNIVWGFLTGDGGVCVKTGTFGYTTCTTYSRDWYYGDIARGEDRTKPASKVIEEYGGWVAGPDAESLANAFLTGKGSSGGSGTTGTVTAGMLEAGKGTTPQFWNTENYTDPEEIVYSNFEIVDENPRVMTASFDSPLKIDLTSGRVAVMITGEVNDFGGIILKREYDSKNKIYKYQCQGFMDRIMANPIYAVCDGSKTVHRLIQEVLNDCGLPDVNLLEEDDYDTYVDEATRELMEKDKDLTETTDIFTSQEDYTVSKSKDGVDYTPDDDDDTKTIKTVTQTASSNKDNTIRNPFKKKPTGIYDCDTMGDFIRTLIFDYGLNVDFYGDVNGIPHFDILELDYWARTGWVVTGDQGFDSNYTSSFDITNIITQVGIKNIQASNGEGEMYTSEELLGVNLENYVGRMGTIEDNPSADVTVNENENEDEDDEVNQLNTVYQDTSGNKYTKTDTISTNGEPSCSNCAKKNGGLQPTMQKYKKNWLNQCPGCKEKNCLEDKSTSSDYKLVCSKCKKEFCEYCGTDRSNANYTLTELFEQFTKSDENKKSSSSGDE